jgi:hypothetical protein
MTEIKRMTPRELFEAVKKFPRFDQITDIDIVMGDVFGKATVTRKALSSEIEIVITCTEYLG